MKNWMRVNKGFVVFVLLFGVFRTAVADWNPIPSGSMSASSSTTYGSLRANACM